MRHIFLASALFFGIPFSSSAAVVISEIMYDLSEGSDSGREWIEIWNSGSESVDISGWKFFEENTNHGVTALEGGTILSAGGYALIVSDPAKFKADYPGFSGILFDSSFSLENTSEEIALKDSGGGVVDFVTYTKEWGAAGDGTSLQKVGATWIAALPTPGAANAAAPSPPPSPAPNPSPGPATSGNSPPPSADSSSSGGSSSSFTPQMSADAGPDRSVIVGADVLFSGQALGFKKEPIDNARFIWNFGDGTIAEGRSVFHRFRFPAEYTVVLDVSSSGYSATDRVRVTATPLQLVIDVVDGDRNALALSNPSTFELDLSGWILSLKNSQFIVPPHTILVAKGKLILAGETTGFTLSQGAVVELLYHNGSILQSFTLSRSAALSIPPQAPVSLPEKKAASPEQPTRTTSSERVVPSPDSLSAPLGKGMSADVLDSLQARVSEGNDATTSRREVSGGVGRAGHYSGYALLVVFVLVIAGSIGVFVARRGESEVDGYTIIEEKDEDDK